MTQLSENITVLLRACVLRTVQDVGPGNSGHLPSWPDSQPHTPAAVEGGSPGDSPVRVTEARGQARLEQLLGVPQTAEYCLPRACFGPRRALYEETRSFVRLLSSASAPQGSLGPGPVPCRSVMTQTPPHPRAPPRLGDIYTQRPHKV